MNIELLVWCHLEVPIFQLFFNFVVCISATCSTIYKVLKENSWKFSLLFETIFCMLYFHEIFLICHKRTFFEPNRNFKMFRDFYEKNMMKNDFTVFM